MKNVKRFDTESAYNVFINTNAFIRPNISLCADTYSIVYNKVLPAAHDYSLDYFTLSILEDGEIRIEDLWDSESSAEHEFYRYDDGEAGYGLKYSLDNGTTWNNFKCYYTDEYNWNYNDETGEPYSEYSYEPVQVHTGDKMLLKALHVNWAIGDSAAPTKIISTCDFNAEGNIMSIIWGDNFIGKTDFLNEYDLPRPNTDDVDLRGNWAFCSLFQDNTHIINAENLILPSLQLNSSCYGSMFNGCTNLLTAPVLPATTLTYECYSGMFSGCTSLTTAPVLPATTLVDSCYSSMFNGCTSLTSITCLATEFNNDYTGINNNLTDGCSDWVDGVAVSGTFTKSNGATWTTGTSGIPSGWTVESV